MQNDPTATGALFVGPDPDTTTTGPSTEDASNAVAVHADTTVGAHPDASTHRAPTHEVVGPGADNGGDAAATPIHYAAGMVRPVPDAWQARAYPNTAVLRVSVSPEARSWNAEAAGYAPPDVEATTTEGVYDMRLPPAAHFNLRGSDGVDRWVGGRVLVCPRGSTCVVLGMTSGLFASLG